MKYKTDFLVIGSGIAGLNFALKASKYGKVAIVTKKELMDYTLDAFQRFYYRPTYMVNQVFRNLIRNDYTLLYSGLRLLFSMKKEMGTFKKINPPAK